MECQVNLVKLYLNLLRVRETKAEMCYSKTIVVLIRADPCVRRITTVPIIRFGQGRKRYVRKRSNMEAKDTQEQTAPAPGA